MSRHYGDFAAHPMAQEQPRWGLALGIVWVLAIALMLGTCGSPVDEAECQPRVETCEGQP